MGAKFSPLMKAGWPVLPLDRAGDKTPLVSGYHGKAAKVADRETVIGWTKAFPECNPGIVLPPGVVGFDVDSASHSHGEDGLAALREFERQFGALPEGPRIFHGHTVGGEPSPYGTRLYRMPEPMKDVYTPGNVVGNLNKVTGKPGVDIIAPWIRYNLAPGAVHASGEVYEWAIGSHGVNSVPTPADLPELSLEQAEALLSRRAKVGKDLVSAEPAPTPQSRAAALLDQVRELAALDEGQTLYIQGAERGWQHNDGFFVLACALVRLAKNRTKAKAAFVEAAGDYTDAERQWDNAVESIEVEEIEVEQEAYHYPPMGMPAEFTREYLQRHHTTDLGTLRLRFNQGAFWLWERTHFRRIEPEEVRAILARDLIGAKHISEDGPERVIVRKGLKAELLDALEAATLVSRHGAGELLPAVGGVPFQNGWLDVDTGKLHPIGPERDIRWVVPANYTEDGECPEWFAFLDSIGFTEGTSERRVIRQWLGWLVSGETSIHKGLLLVGPKRAGKGTILAVAEALLGEGAIGLQLADLTTNFGLQNMIGKGLVTIGDARFGFRTDKQIIEKLLLLTSFEAMQIDVKYGKPVNVRPTARLMIASNETPKFIEASDALATRFVIVQFTESFYGREDLGLKSRIRSELPAIARWALDGYREVIGLGGFSETEKGLELQEQMIHDAAPVRSFVESECRLDAQVEVMSQDLYDRYTMWCDRNGMFKMDSAGFFRDLNTAFPGKVSSFRKRIAGRQVYFKRGITLS